MMELRRALAAVPSPTAANLETVKKSGAQSLTYWFHGIKAELSRKR
jgi:hypothetical protein